MRLKVYSAAIQQRLAKVAGDLKKSGVHVMVSQTSTVEMRRMYRNVGLRVIEVDARRNINSDGGKRGEVREILAT